MPAALRPVGLPHGELASSNNNRSSGAIPDAMPGSRRVILRYRERARVMVRGPVTGQSYEFSAVQPTQSVDTRDAEVLLLTRYFIRA